MRVDGDEQLRLLVRERFPSWWEVQNEQAAAIFAAERREKRRRRDLARLTAMKKPVAPVDQLAAARSRKQILERQRILTEALREDTDDLLAE